jgi:hypothetical protein
MNVFSMVQKVLADSEMKLQKMAADEESGEETKKDEEKDEEPEGGEKKEKEASLHYFLKVAEACDYLADRIHTVVDNRTPTEKLAEYMAIQEELLKRAEDVPTDPPLDAGITPGAPGTAMVATPALTTGGPILHGGDSGQATGGNQPPPSPDPSESATPADANTAMESNKDMMFSEQPEEVLKQSADVLNYLVSRGRINADMAKTAFRKGSPKAKTASAVPPRFSKILSKFAADAENPAQISAGTEPILQSVPGAPNVQMQGSTVGELVPPTKGQTEGRQLISSNQAAIDATKREAKAPVKSPLAEVLNEPALSAAHDHVLQKSLDSTSEAGVKISAARELLRKIAASSPEAMAEIKRMVKAAEMGAPIPPPGESVGEAVDAVATEAPVSDEAMAAAAEGVTTDELAKAQTLLAAQAQGSMSAAGAGAPPMGGAMGAGPEATVPSEAAPVA